MVGAVNYLDAYDSMIREYIDLQRDVIAECAPHDTGFSG